MCRTCIKHEKEKCVEHVKSGSKYDELRKKKCVDHALNMKKKNA